MKKFLNAIIIAILVAVLGLSGCTQAIELEFSEAFLGKDTSLISETLVFDVKNEDSFGTEFKKDAKITDELIEYSFEGTYTMHWEELAVMPQSSTLLNKPIKSDIIPSVNAGFYKLTTSLEITANYYSLQGEEKNDTKNDFIKTETYFAPQTSAFAPIYSETDADYTFISIKNQSPLIYRTKYSCYTTYNTTTYTINKKINSATNYSSQVYKYNIRTLIDNAQLIFLLRNTDLSVDNTTIIPTVSMQYGKSVDLEVKNKNISSVYYSNPNNQENKNILTINGVPFDDSLNSAECKIPVNRYAFKSANNKSAGTEKTLFIQNTKVGNLPMRATPVQYIEPICDLTSFLSLGVMTYTLRSIQTING